ncbi:MAG TPA: glycosyltransferase family 4 protein [Pyrinomonadaceae bacterium]|nr:glycosyltransferase family 4 protein [Pyrinomonadaceae bacterium]
MAYLPGLKGKKVLLVSHELTFTGAPLLLAETGVAMARSGAEVSLTSLRIKEASFHFSAYEGLQPVSIDDSFAIAAEADIIIANTAVTKSWVRMLLLSDVHARRKLVWWIHEIDLKAYGNNMENLGLAAAAIFDSEGALQRWQQSGLPMPAITKAIHPGLTSKFLKDAARSQPRQGWASRLKSIFNGHQPPARDEFRTKLGVNPQDFLITLIGSYCPLKGHDLLVATVGQMLASSPGLPLKLLLIGFRNVIQRQGFLKKLSPRELAAVETKRTITSVADVKPYYLASDALVLNTQPPGETFGRVSIEAMAYGLPVLATDAGGTREIVVDGVTGLFHPAGPEGQAKLSQNIRSLMEDRSRAKSLGAAGYKRAKTLFRVERFYREFDEVMRCVLAECLTRPKLP